MPDMHFPIALHYDDFFWADTVTVYTFSDLASHLIWFPNGNSTTGMWLKQLLDDGPAVGT